jgi:FixJ family two-component response regulator
MPERPLVAIVDDDASHRRATQNLLRSEGFSTTAFADAESFLAFALRARTDCLVTDMRMPGMSGLELYEALVVAGQHIPTILVSAYTEELTRARALNAGIACFLGKPFAAEDLLECIRKALPQPQP